MEVGKLDYLDIRVVTPLDARRFIKDVYILGGSVMSEHQRFMARNVHNLHPVAAIQMADKVVGILQERYPSIVVLQRRNHDGT